MYHAALSQVAAPIDGVLARLVMDAYLALRRLRAQGLLGQPWKPSSGLAAGCSLAIHILACCLIP